MLDVLLELALTVLLLALSGLAAGLSAWRSTRSENLSGVLFAGVFLFSATAAAGVLGAIPNGKPLSLLTTVMAIAALPLWALLREICRKPDDAIYGGPIPAVFRSERARYMRAEPEAKPQK